MASPGSSAVSDTVSLADPSPAGTSAWPRDMGDSPPAVASEGKTKSALSDAIDSGAVSQDSANADLVSQAGYQGPSYSGATNSPSSDKPESKLWWNDGSWWGDLFDTVSGSWHIFRLNRSTETWVDTGTPIDSRPNTLADALWDGTHLYVASHWVTISSDTETTLSIEGYPAYLYRFSYTKASQTYTLDSGFPAIITNWSSESMTIDKDSTGVIWATWTQVTGPLSSATNAVYFNHSVQGNDASWGTPTKLDSVTGIGTTADPSPDDISALVSYRNSYIGVLWSNQLTQKFYWATHKDGDPASSWQESVALGGSNAADDHMNVKTLQSDAAGRVYAAVKTSADLGNSGSAALIDLLVFTPGTGAWSTYTFGTVNDCHTRPIVVLDSDHQTIHMYATAPTAGDGCPYTGVPGSIYEKTAPMGDPVFGAGPGSPVIQNPSSHNINDATSTKQPVTGASGIVVLASDSGTNHYWFTDEPLGTVPPPVASFTANPTSGTVPLPVKFTDTSTGNPTSWSWDFGDGSPVSNLESPGHNYKVAGTYTARLTATNSGGSTMAQTTITVSPAAGVPGKTTGVTAIAGNALAVVSWTAPVDNGSPITGYAVTSSPGSRTCSTSGGLTCTVSGLTNGTLYTFTVVASNSVGPGPASDPSAAVIPHSGATFHAITPTRILDSRNGTGGLGMLHSHVAQTFKVTGGSGGVPLNATAVTGNLTVTQQTSLGFLYLGPAPLNDPTSSTLNFPAGDDRANAVTVQLGAGGTLSVTYAAPTYGATAQVIFDVTGYFVPGDSTGSTYHALTPTRILDSRDGTGGTAIFSSHVAQHFQVTGGSSGVPAGATAVTGNLTVTQQSSQGFLYIGPNETNYPTSSTLNFPAGDDRANAVTVALDSSGYLWVTYAAPTLGPAAQVIFDVTGYFTPDLGGATYVPLPPARLLDTRYGTGLPGAFTSHVARGFQVTGGSSGVPAGATAVTGNLTVTQQTSLGFLYVGNNAMNDPTSSTLNFPARDDRANAVAVALDPSGYLWVTYAAPILGPTVQVIFDVTGYFAP